MNWQNYKCLLVPMLGLVLAFTFCLTNPVAAEEEPQLNILTLREAFIKDGKMTPVLPNPIPFSWSNLLR